MSLGHGSQTVRDGLVFHIDAANPKCTNGIDTCVDLIGKKNGSFNGNAQITEDGFNFSSEGDWLSFSSSGLNLTENITLNCWAKHTHNSDSQTLIRNKFSNESRYRLSTNGNEFQWQSWTSTGARVTRETPSTNWDINQWNNFCISFQTIYSGRNNLYFYLNGEMVHEAELNYILGSSGYPILIGGGYNGGGTPVAQFYGNISISSIYAKTLTPEQVKQNYNAVKDRYNI